MDKPPASPTEIEWLGGVKSDTVGLACNTINYPHTKQCWMCAATLVECRAKPPLAKQTASGRSDTDFERCAELMNAAN